MEYDCLVKLWVLSTNQIWYILHNKIKICFDGIFLSSFYNYSNQKKLSASNISTFSWRSCLHHLYTQTLFAFRMWIRSSILSLHGSSSLSLLHHKSLPWSADFVRYFRYDVFVASTYYSPTRNLLPRDSYNSSFHNSAWICIWSILISVQKENITQRKCSIP